MAVTHESAALEVVNNQLLTAIPPEQYRRMRSSLELVHLPRGTVLHERYTPFKYVYFPEDCIVSLLWVTRRGDTAEVSVVGLEGVVGVSLIMGSDTTSSRAVVQSEGYAYRMVGDAMKEELRRAGPVPRLFLRYTLALLTQMGQTALCNRHHCLSEQLCRWLLLSRDRIRSDELVMTQELIARMLGVRREGVTAAAGELQKAGLIRYVRGHITIVDRAGLEARSCECYEVVKREYARLLPWTSGTGYL